MSLYFLQHRAEFVLFAVWNHLCFWRRRRLVCVVIHGWWNLLLVVLEGTWESMAAVKLSWMQSHRVSGSSLILNLFKNECAKSSTSCLRWTRSAFFQSLMVWGCFFSRELEGTINTDGGVVAETWYSGIEINEVGAISEKEV